MRRGAAIAAVAITAVFLAGTGPDSRSKSSPRKTDKAAAQPMRLRVGPDEVLTISLYLNRLRDGQAYLAVDEYFDVDGFIARLFGDDIKSLLSEEYAYVRQMSCVLVKATITLVSPEEWKKPVPAANLRLTRVEADAATVKLTRPVESGHGGVLLFELHRGVKGWRIVDLPPLAESLRGEYQRLKADKRLGPVGYLEMLTARTLDQKRTLQEREAAKVSTETDPR